MLYLDVECCHVVMIDIFTSSSRFRDGLGKDVTDNALFSSQSLLSFKDIYWNGYHTKTDRKNGIKYLYIISTISNEKRIFERFPALSYGFYYTHIWVIEIYATMDLKLMNPDIYAIWHNRLAHPGSIMIRIIIHMDIYWRTRRFFNLMNYHVMLALKKNQ